MVSIKANIFEIVMLTARSDALLRIRSPWVGRRLLPGEVGHKLVHSGIRKQQVWRTRHDRCRWDHCVRFGCEKIEKGLADVSGFHDDKSKASTLLFFSHGYTRIEHRYLGTVPWKKSVFHLCTSVA